MAHFYLNNKKTFFKKGETILDRAKKEGVKIPHLCHNPEFKSRAVCRVCVVEISGQPKLVTACSTKIETGMRVKTNSPKVIRARNLNLQLIFASHREECADCLLLYNCPLLKYAKDYKLSIARFKDRKNIRKKYNFDKAIEIDASQCIDCGICVDVCKMGQKIDCLEFKNKGLKQELKPKKNNKCIYCGQCTLHCPVFAAQEQQKWPELERVLKDKQDKILIAQIAPSIRASLSESFNLGSGKFSLDLIRASLSQLGFDYVFDVNFGADITTLVEAQELIERLKDKEAKLPMFSSCCPAWVVYVEKIRPDLRPYLTTSRSPQMHNAALIKSYFAEKNKIDSKKIVLVSIMPCTAKKFERNRKEFKGLVDHVLTVREFAFLLKKNKINPSELKAERVNDIMSDSSGAAAIFGASGGVMESALRSAHHSLKSGKSLAKIDFKELRGIKGLREAKVKLGKKNLNIAIVSGIANLDFVLANLDKYHYIEVMACPGGCVGGGGQIIPTNLEIIKKRTQSLYSLDKKLKKRRADDNILAKKAIKWLEDNNLDHKLLHTKYYKRK